MVENEEAEKGMAKEGSKFRVEDLVAEMDAPLQPLRELVLWPSLFSQEAAALGPEGWVQLLLDPESDIDSANWLR